MLTSSSEGLTLTGLRDFKNWGVVHHPDCWASALGIFILRRCIVQHLRYILLLVSLWTAWRRGDFVTSLLPWELLLRLLGASLELPVLHTIRLIILGGFYGGTLAWRVLWRSLTRVLVLSRMLYCFLIGLILFAWGLYGLMNRSFMAILLGATFYPQPYLLLRFLGSVGRKSF